MLYLISIIISILFIAFGVFLWSYYQWKKTFNYFIWDISLTFSSLFVLGFFLISFIFGLLFLDISFIWSTPKAGNGFRAYSCGEKIVEQIQSERTLFNSLSESQQKIKKNQLLTDSSYLIKNPTIDAFSCGYLLGTTEINKFIYEPLDLYGDIALKINNGDFRSSIFNTPKDLKSFETGLITYNLINLLVLLLITVYTHRKYFRQKDKDFILQDPKKLSRYISDLSSVDGEFCLSYIKNVDKIKVRIKETIKGKLLNIVNWTGTKHGIVFDFTLNGNALFSVTFPSDDISLDRLELEEFKITSQYFHYEPKDLKTLIIEKVYYASIEFLYQVAVDQIELEYSNRSEQEVGKIELEYQDIKKKRTLISKLNKDSYKLDHDLQQTIKNVVELEKSTVNSKILEKKYKKIQQINI